MSDLLPYDYETDDELVLDEADYTIAGFIETGGYDDAVDAWLAAQISPHTVRSYRKALDQWRAYLDELELVLVDDPTSDQYNGPRRHHADRWRSLLRTGQAAGLGEHGRRNMAAKPLGKKSVDSRLVAVRSFYDYLVAEQAVDVNPIRGVRLFNSGPEHQAQALDPSELERLTDAAHATHVPLPRALVLFLATTGCRISEALGLRVADLHRTSGYPTVTVTRKGGDRQTIVIDAPVYEHLLHMVGSLPAEAFVFSRDAGRTSISYAAARYLLDTIAKKAGLIRADRRSLHPHMLRATLITTLLNDKVPVEQVQEYVGHSKAETTLGYFRGRGQLPKQAEIAAKMGSMVHSSRGLEEDVA